MKKTLLSALLGLAIVISCEKKQETTENQDHTNHTENVAAETEAEAPAEATHDDHADASANLELNNGKKWKTNTEMLPYIQKQEQLIDAYDDETGDYKKLAADLSAANDQLIKSCTMTGKSHDVLHVWLTDHMKKINLLAKAATQKEAEKIAEALEHSMESYHQYFE